MTIIAVADKIIAKELKEENFDQTPGGIFIPEASKEAMKPYYRGEVISVGEDVTAIKVGDIIYSAKNWGQTFIIEKEVYKTYGLSEIFGVLKEDE